MCKDGIAKDARVDGVGDGRSVHVAQEGILGYGEPRPLGAIWLASLVYVYVHVNRQLLAHKLWRPQLTTNLVREAHHQWQHPRGHAAA